ncbi:hypothetical protein C8J57DRAFT_1304914, partial [Mycena rebaudengoi]
MLSTSEKLGAAKRKKIPTLPLRPLMHRHLSSVHSSPTWPLLKILGIWALGGVVAVAHHVFYSQLRDRPVQAFQYNKPTAIFHSQEGASAVGTTLAHLASLALATSIGIAFMQATWKLVRSGSFTVADLDAMWCAPNSAMSFLQWNLWKQPMTRGVMVVAAMIRLSSLVVTFVPGTLTVQAVIETRLSQCNVPTFDLGKNALLYESEFNSPLKPYSQPSSLALRLAGATLLGGQPLSPTSPCDGNCTYTISVIAPSFN